MTPAFQMQRMAQFAETDAAGIVHFSNYFRWMEELEHAFFRSVGLSVCMTDADSREISWPRVSASCCYTGPVRFEEVVTLRLFIERLGGKSLSYRVEFESAGRPLANGKITCVCCDVSHGGMRAIDIPPAIRERLQSTSPT